MNFPTRRALCAATLMTLAPFALSQSTSAPKPQADTTPPQKAGSEAPSRHLDRGSYLAREALKYRGVPYRFGGTSLRGVDCSGLTLSVCRRWGLLLPRTSTEQYGQGVAVPRDAMQPGDLVFFRNTYRHGISHVGIFVGDGKFVHAAGRHRGVIVSSLSEPYFQHRFAGARRLPMEKLPAPEDDATADVAEAK